MAVPLHVRGLCGEPGESGPLLRNSAQFWNLSGEFLFAGKNPGVGGVRFAAAARSLQQRSGFPALRYSGKREGSALVVTALFLGAAGTSFRWASVVLDLVRVKSPCLILGSSGGEVF